jgi:hypothetical protein
MNWKNNIKELQHSRWHIARAVYAVLRPVGRFLADSRYRAEMLSRWQFRNKQHQGSVYTAEDRYPLLFAACRDYLSSCNKPSILSFGCSTGQEVATIGAYLPRAIIMGVDINEWCIKQCKKKYSNTNWSFYHRFSKEFEASVNFDAIFCMAVFQRTENRLNTDNETASGLTFEQFEQEILMLDAKLKTGGLFIIDHSDFSFTDTICNRHYSPLNFDKNKLLRNRPLFDKNNKKISETQNNYRVFIKG